MNDISLLIDCCVLFQDESVTMQRQCQQCVSPNLEFAAVRKKTLAENVNVMQTVIMDTKLAGVGILLYYTVFYCL